jgi:hypothetical protein
MASRLFQETLARSFQGEVRRRPGRNLASLRPYLRVPPKRESGPSRRRR